MIVADAGEKKARVFLTDKVFKVGLMIASKGSNVWIGACTMKIFTAVIYGFSRCLSPG